MSHLSTSETNAVYNWVMQCPSVYDLFKSQIDKDSAASVEFMRSFTREFLKLEGFGLFTPLSADLLDSALRDVRWSEIRNEIRRLES